MPPNLIDLILDTFPANSDTGVSLLSNITVTLSGIDYDTDTLLDGLFIEGPDTDQLVGPGLLNQIVPNNISQGDINDFLQSPGYTGIVKGVTTVTGISGNTTITFDPTYPLAALTDYRVYLTDITTSGIVPVHTPDTISGVATFTFKTGSGSIETIPSSVSSSVLADTFIEQQLTDTSIALSVVKTTPADNSIEQVPSDLQEITIEFNKAVDPTTIQDANISIVSSPVTDHPGINISSSGTIAKTLEVNGNIVKIKI